MREGEGGGGGGGGGEGGGGTGLGGIRVWSGVSVAGRPALLYTLPAAPAPQMIMRRSSRFSSCAFHICSIDIRHETQLKITNT